MPPSTTNTPTTQTLRTPKHSRPRSTPFTQTLLSRAHSPTTASRIHADKIAHKPLILHATRSNATTTTPTAHDARSTRRAARALKHQQHQQATRRRKRTKPGPLTARQKRALCVYEIPPAERRWELYVGLHALWQGYMREVLGVAGGEGTVRKAAMAPGVAGPKIASADMHGAEIECVRSACVSRVGVRGVVVRDTKFTFVVVTRGDRVRVLPKEGSWFRVEVEIGSKAEGEGEGGGEGGEGDRDGVGVGGKGKGETTKGNGREQKKLVFDLQGEQFKNRAPERARKKFKMHLPKDL